MKMRPFAGVTSKGLLAAKAGVPMENNCAIDQAEFEFSYEFPDETLEIAAVTGGEKTNRITLYYCTALYFCPAP
jgi:hypothetical protein